MPCILCSCRVRKNLDWEKIYISCWCFWFMSLPWTFTSDCIILYYLIRKEKIDKKFLQSMDNICEQRLLPARPKKKVAQNLVLSPFNTNKTWTLNTRKDPAYGRQQLSRSTEIVAPMLFFLIEKKGRSGCWWFIFIFILILIFIFICIFFFISIFAVCCLVDPAKSLLPGWSCHNLRVNERPKKRQEWGHQTHKQTDIVTTRPTRPTGAELVKRFNI